MAERPLFRIEDYRDRVISRSNEAASIAFKQAREQTERQELKRIESKWSGRKILFVFDQHRSTSGTLAGSRIGKHEFSEYEAIATTYRGFLYKAQRHICQFHNADHWEAIKEELKKLGDVEPTLDQPLVFAVGCYHYGFYCIKGKDLYQKLLNFIDSAKRETKERENR